MSVIAGYDVRAACYRSSVAAISSVQLNCSNYRILTSPSPWRHDKQVPLDMGPINIYDVYAPTCVGGSGLAAATARFAAVTSGSAAGVAASLVSSSNGVSTSPTSSSGPPPRRKSVPLANSPNLAFTCVAWILQCVHHG